MKKLILAIMILVTAISFSQSLQKEIQHPDIAGRLFRNPVLKKDKPLGSPYFQNAFARAKVVNIKVEAYMRYNVYNDEFEFITPKNDTLILDKIDNFGNIAFPGLNRKYSLLAYVNNKKLVYGYLLDIYEKDGYAIYKKENIVFTEAKKAKTSLEVNMPAKYTNAGDDFFLKNKDAGTVEFPDSKKALIKLFPEKKEVIESFLKENKINFDSEPDLIRIVNLLAK